MEKTKQLLPGERIGHLKVISRERKGRRYYYHCKCDCGSETNIGTEKLEQGKQTACLCKGKYLKLNRTYGSLTVKKRLKRGIYECDCSCGRTITVTTSDVLSEKVQSCGCGRKPYNRKTRKDSTTGVKGVVINKRNHKFSAFISKKGKNRYLGTFETIEEAKKAREKAENEMKENDKN